MSTSKNILILGGAGIQNTHVIRELSQGGHNVRVLSRNPERDTTLATLPGVELVKGDTYDEQTLLSNFKDIEAVYVNTNGFAIGEKSEIYWDIRIYEIAYYAGVKHLVYGSLPYVSKKGGFNPKYRVPFTDGKAKFVDYLRSQETDVMNWTVLESGPYADSFLYESWVPRRDENGVYVFEIGIGEQGHVAFVSLTDLGWFARHIFEKPEEFRGDLLSVGIEHTSAKGIAEAFTAVTGKPARFQAQTNEQISAAFPDFKLGTAHSPGYDDPTLLTARETFKAWLNIWAESGDNTGLWTRDYDRLDKIKPDRIRTLEQWMRSVDYKADMAPQKKLQTGLAPS